MRLVGASYGFIRKPFISKAVTIGIVSALIACVLLAAGIFYLIKYDPEIQELVTWQTVALTAGAVVACGLLITWLSAHIAVTHYLKMSRNKIYTH